MNTDIIEKEDVRELIKMMVAKDLNITPTEVLIRILRTFPNANMMPRR